MYYLVYDRGHTIHDRKQSNGEAVSAFYHVQYDPYRTLKNLDDVLLKHMGLTDTNLSTVQVNTISTQTCNASKTQILKQLCHDLSWFEIDKYDQQLTLGVTCIMAIGVCTWTKTSCMNIL